MSKRQQPSNNNAAGYSADTGQGIQPNYGQAFSGQFPMIPYMGMQRQKPDRGAPTCDQDLQPRQFRQYVNVGVKDVQINNGMRWRVLSGLRIGYAGTGYMYGVVPQIPGQTRDNVAGYHKRGPSPFNVADVFTMGPGSQPAHPGGPGKIVGPTFYNPMTG